MPPPNPPMAAISKAETALHGSALVLFRTQKVQSTPNDWDWGDVRGFTLAGA